MVSATSFIMDKNGTEVGLFIPPGDNKYMRDEYPELREHEEFSKLPDYHLRFVWYFANPTSPIINLSEPDRVVQAVEFTFKEGASEAERKNFIRCKFTPEIRAAIKVMARFNPAIRLRAKINAGYIFRTIEKMIYIDESRIRNMQMDDRKRYAELSIKVMNEMPGMISIMERGFGIVGPSNKKKHKEPGEEKLPPVEETIKDLEQK